MRQELGVVRPRGGSHPNDKDTMPGIEDKRASLATLAHGAKKTPKTLDEMTEVAQVIDCATAVVDKVNAQLGLPVAAEGTERLQEAEKAMWLSATALIGGTLHHSLQRGNPHWLR